MESDLRSYVASTAINWLGLKESDGSFKPIIDVYNRCAKQFGLYIMSYTDPWCAAFVTAVAWKCGLTAVIFPECSCDRMINLYKKAGRWQENDNYKAEVGDIIFYDWDDNGSGDCVGSSDHVGIIVSATESTLRVVEGNRSDAVGQQTIQRNSRFIRGFGCPDYSVKTYSGQTDSDKAENTVSGITSQIKVEPEVRIAIPMLRKGSIGGFVKSLQLLLIEKGYSCGNYGSDGHFGSATQSAVISFQTEHSLEVDGIVGEQTWYAILSK